MEALASFVFSEQGVLYGKVCKEWGVDPGAPYADDFVAYNVRAGLLASMAQAITEEPELPRAEPRTDGRIVTDLEEQMRRV